MKGLKAKPTYGSLVGVAFPDGSGQIKFPKGGASVLRNGFVMGQLDNEGTRHMQLQLEASRHAFSKSL